MKLFSQFLSESTAVQQATRLGLTGDGHGGWYKDGEFVAKTEKGQLKFYNKRQKVGQQDPAQTDKEKRLSAPRTVAALLGFSGFLQVVYIDMLWPSWNMVY